MAEEDVGGSGRGRGMVQQGRGQEDNNKRRACKSVQREGINGRCLLKEAKQAMQ